MRNLIVYLLLLLGGAKLYAVPLLAVAPLEGRGLASAELETITQSVVNEWVKLGVVRVVERAQLGRLLDEQALQMSGACGDSCRVQAAQVLGVRFLVVGSVGRVGQTYDLQLRLLDVDNGQVLASHEVPFRKHREELLLAVPTAVRSLARKSESWLLRSDPEELRSRRLAMVAIPAGTYLMGSDQVGAGRDEKPVHPMLVKAFYLDSTEVTQGSYRALLHRNPSVFAACDSCPVENVSWHSALAYCQRLGKRLPTEAEWEYAARAGSPQAYFWGDSVRGMETYTGSLTARSTYPVRSTRPNGWGLYEMAGNVSEWVQDWYSRDAYQFALPQGPADGKKKVQRGGHWYGNSSLYRVARRGYADPDQQSGQTGFRCAMDVIQDEAK